MTFMEPVSLLADGLCMFVRINVSRRHNYPFIRGDSNKDAAVNIADAIYILQNLFASGAPIVCQDAADANDDESVNIADAIYILQNLFANGPPLPPPGACGPDPDEGGALDCRDSTCR